VATAERLREPFQDAVKISQPSVGVVAMVSAAVIALLVSIPGVQSDVMRPIDLIGVLAWVVALGGRGGRLARVLLIAAIAVVTTSVAAMWLYPSSIVANQALLLIRFLAVLGPLAAVYVARLDRRQGRRLINVCAAATVLACGSAIVGYQANNPGTYAHQTFLDGSAGGLVHRLGGWVGESGAYGALAVVASFAIAIAFASSRVRLLGYSAGIALLLISYTLSLARVCLIAAGVMLVCVLVAEYRRASFWLLFMPAAVAAFFLASAAGVMPELSAASLDRLDMSGGNFTSSRSEHWALIFQALAETGALLTGLGVRGANALLQLPTENLFVAAIADFGVLFGIVFLLIIGKMWVDFSRDARAIPSPPTKIMVRGMLIAVLLQWMFNDVPTYYQAFPLFALTLGAALSLGTPPAFDHAVLSRGLSRHRSRRHAPRQAV
jgi:hypothetical protein